MKTIAELRHDGERFSVEEDNVGSAWLMRCCDEDAGPLDVVHVPASLRAGVARALAGGV